MAVRSIFLAWVGPDEVFDAVVHARRDEQVRGVVISENEGEFPLADVRILHDGGGLLAADRKRRAFVSLETDAGIELAFAGRVVGFPLAVAGQEATIQLVAKPDDWQERQKDVLDQVKTTAVWDPAFVPSDRHDDPVEVLAATPHLLHWHRATGACSLTHLLDGSTVIDLGKQWFEPEELRLEIARRPLSRVELVVEAQWEQWARGTLDITAELEAAFGGEVSTLTPDDWERSWSQTTGLTATGVQLAESRMKRMDFTWSDPFEVKVADVLTLDPVIDEDADQKWDLLFEETRYDCHLAYDVEYRQARRETLTASVGFDLQPLVDDGETEPLVLRLENIDDQLFEWITWTVSADGIDRRSRGRPAPAFLFDALTGELRARGAEAMGYAYRRALALGLRRARTLELEIECPAHSVIGITCDRSVRLEHPLFPGGELSGKVVGYSLDLADEAIARITLGVSVGNGGGAAPAADNVVVDYGAVGGAHVGLSASSPSAAVQVPVDATRLTDPDYMIASLVVLNPGSQQRLGVWTGTLAQTPEGWLEEHQTSMGLQLRSLDAVDELATEAAMPDVSTAVPRGVDLSAPGGGG